MLGERDDTFRILELTWPHTWQYRIPKTAVNKEYNLHILFPQVFYLIRNIFSISLFPF
jgi:hypothetical protein